MRQRLLITTMFFVFMLLGAPGFGQQDEIGPGRAIQFDGVDDYIDLGNIYDDIQFPLTISAWIYKDNSSQYILPIFVSQDNAPLYNGFWFCLSSTNLFFEYGDGRGEQSTSFRKGKSAVIPNLENRWIYVSAVITSSNDIQLFANGVNVGGSVQGSSNLPMSSNYPSDIAKIGYFYTNASIHRFQGMIDELRIWNRALSQNELRESMCQRLREGEPGLIGHWTFDETSGTQVKDESSKAFHGSLKGNPTRVFSGAPVGDESVFLYRSDWSGATLTKDDLTVSKISGSPFGVHVYTVGVAPSQTGGLDVPSVRIPYHGVFLADAGGNNTFDFAYADGTCAVSHRNDNSKPQWMPLTVFTGIRSRMEMIRSFEQAGLEIELGNDVLVCDEASYWIKPNGISSGQRYLWNTGETSSDITVTKSGVYRVEVSQGCEKSLDSLKVTFSKMPPSFSLGEDEELCELEPRILAVDFNTEGMSLIWQDGSDGTSLQADAFGTYWLKVENTCGVSIDSITFTGKEFNDIRTYNYMSPDTGDEFNQFFILDERLTGSRLMVFNRWGKEVYSSLNYQNDWDAGGLAPGMYFYVVAGECIEPLKGVVTIMK